MHTPVPSSTFVRLAVSAIALVAIVLAGSSARAEPSHVSLGWRAPLGCSDGEAVIADVERLIRGTKSTENVEAEAEISVVDAAYRVRLRTRTHGESGERIVEAASCAQVASATAVILALMIDPEAAARAPMEEAEPERPRALRSTPPSPPPIAAPFAPPRDAVEPSPRSKLALSFVASADFVGEMGTLPGATPGGGLAFAALLGAYRIELRGAFFPEANAALAARAATGADLSMIAVELDACRALLQHPRARADICAGAEIDRVRGRGYGVTSPSEGSTALGAGALDALLDVPMTARLSAELRAGATANFSRSPFYFEGLGTVYRPAIVAGRLAGGVAVHF